MIKYKLTDTYNQTRKNTKWGQNICHTTEGGGNLCGPGWLHFYHHPLLAVMLNEIHASFLDYHLWECEAEGEMLNDQWLKGGCTKLTTLRQIEIPKIPTKKQFINFAMLFAKELMSDKMSDTWYECLKSWEKDQILIYDHNRAWADIESRTCNIYEQFEYCFKDITSYDMEHAKFYSALFIEKASSHCEYSLEKLVEIAEKAIQLAPC